MCRDVPGWMHVPDEQTHTPSSSFSVIGSSSNVRSSSMSWSASIWWSMGASALRVREVLNQRQALARHHAQLARHTYHARIIRIKYFECLNQSLLRIWLIGIRPVVKTVASRGMSLSRWPSCAPMPVHGHHAWGAMGMLSADGSERQSAYGMYLNASACSAQVSNVAYEMVSAAESVSSPFSILHMAGRILFNSSAAVGHSSRNRIVLPTSSMGSTCSLPRS